MLRAGGAPEPEGPGVVSQMWESVARMTALARGTTQSFLDASAALGQHPPSSAAAAGLPGVHTHAIERMAAAWMAFSRWQL